MAHSPEERLHEALVASGKTLALAESCTGGLIAHRITRLAGCSAYFDRGLVVYSNRAKTELLGVSENTLEQFGAVSEETAIALVGGLIGVGVDFAGSVTDSPTSI